MRAITVRDREADDHGLSLTELPYPHAAENDVIVQVHAAGFLRGEPDWPGTWATAPAATGHQVSSATNCPVWSSSSATAPPVSRSVSGSSG